MQVRDGRRTKAAHHRSRPRPWAFLPAATIPTIVGVNVNKKMTAEFVEDLKKLIEDDACP